MEFAQQFFSGLDGPASVTFLGILAGAFLLGLLPAGLTYAFRVRDARARLEKHVAAHQRARQESQMLAKRLEQEQTRGSGLEERARREQSERARQLAELARLRDELAAAQAETLSAQVAARDAADRLAALQGRVGTLQAQVQSLKAMQRPQAAPGGFDLDLMANLKTARQRSESLEERVRQLTADNEQLRRELAG